MADVTILHRQGAAWLDTIRGAFLDVAHRPPTSQETADHLAWILEGRDGGWTAEKIRASIAAPSPQPAGRRAVAVVLPVAGASVYVDDIGGGHTGTTDANGYVEFSVTPLPITFVRVMAAGYRPYQANGVRLPDGNTQIRIGVPADPARPTDVILPALDRDRPPPIRFDVPPWPAGAYDRALPWTPPDNDRDFLCGDWWGVPVPELPRVLGGPSGGSDEHPERLITGLDYKYDRALWPRMVEEHLRRRYRHWGRWWPNARDDGGNSIAQFVDDCLRLKDLGMRWITVSLGAKPWQGVFDPRDQSVQQWQDRLGPILSALLAQHAADEVIPGFEWDLWNVPGDTTLRVCKWVGQQAHAAGASCWLHFSPHVTGWWSDGRGRAGFWDDLGADVDGLLYQTGAFVLHDQAIRAPWSIQDTQARIVDTLWQFGVRGNVHKFRFCEDLAWLEFSLDRDDLGQPVNEAVAAQRGFLACCTVDNVQHTDAKVWGASNGLMRADGSPFFPD